MRKNIETNINTQFSEYATLPLNLPVEAIEEFQALYLQTYHKKISFTEATAYGTRLLRQVLPVYKSIPKARKDKLNE